MEHGWAFLHHVIEHYNVVFIHAAPPCGTCSRAREIPLGPGGGPKQLRNEEYPSGLPHLEGRDLERVQLANALYNGLTRFLTQCTLQETPWSVENPTSSYLWPIPCFVNLIADTPCRFYNYDTCAWGSTRKLQRSFLSTLPEMCGIHCVLATMNMPLLGAHGRVTEPLNLLLVTKRHIPNSCVFKLFPLCKMLCNFFHKSLKQIPTMLQSTIKE